MFVALSVAQVITPFHEYFFSPFPEFFGANMGTGYLTITTDAFVTLDFNPLSISPTCYLIPGLICPANPSGIEFDRTKATCSTSET